MQGAVSKLVGKMLVTFAWWWIFYHILTDPSLIFGHLEYPDTSKWTDAELGIPADDEE